MDMHICKPYSITGAPSFDSPLTVVVNPIDFDINRLQVLERLMPRKVNQLLTVVALVLT